MLRSTRLFALFAIIVMLGACDMGGGYGTRQWEPAKQTAEQPPSPLSEIYDTALPQTTPPQEVIEQPLAPIEAELPSVKVAILVPLSGKHKTLGDSMLKAAQIALFDLGHSTFQLTPHDTKGTSDGARAAAKAARENGAQLVLGPLFADSVRAAKTITEPARIPMIAFSTDWSLAGNNTFIMGFLPFDQVARLTQYIASQDINRIGLITPQSKYGRAVTNAYEQLAPRFGIQTTERAEFAPQTANLAPTLREFTRFDSRQAVQDPSTLPLPFDAVLMPVGGRQASAIANLLSHYDLPPRDVRRLGTGLMDDLSLATETSLNGTWFAAPSPDLRRNFEKKYIATYGMPAPRLSTLAYDATALAAVLAQRGLKNNGRPDFTRNAILNPNGFFGIDGIFRFRRDGTAERGLAILEINRGRIKVIDPPPTTFERSQF